MIYKNKKIIVAPLNWGLGHASRCIPIINELIKANYIPIIASDGAALKLLQKEFPDLKSYTLPSYNIKYTSRGNLLKYTLILSIPRILKAIRLEKQFIEHLHKRERVVGIISDNRFGVRSKSIPSIYITHQTRVLSGSTTFLSSWLHRKIISKFNDCWIPDHSDSRLSGVLSKSTCLNDIKYIGALSRLQYQKTEKIWDIMVLLSGPEPQRSILEKRLLEELKGSNKRILFIRGVLDDDQVTSDSNGLRVINYMMHKELQNACNQSKIIISRSGYSTIMDLYNLKSKSFFIPTPGQYEQEYLARYLNENKIAPYSLQDDFTLKMIEKVKSYHGFSPNKKAVPTDFEALFKKSFLRK